MAELKPRTDDTHILCDAEKDKEFKIINRKWKTAGTYLACVCLGLLFPLVGVTETNMEILYRTTTDGFSAAFIGRALGYLSGSILCGLIYSRMNPELQLSVSCGLQALPVIVAPFLPLLGGYSSAIVIHRIACGFIDTVAETYVIQLWPNSKYVTSLLIGQTVALSVGSTISPFIISPFLTSLKSLKGEDCHHLSSVHFSSHTIEGGDDGDILTAAHADLKDKLKSGVNNTILHAKQVKPSKVKRHANKADVWPVPLNCHDPGSINSTSSSKVSKVRFAYVTIGSITFVAAIYFCGLLLFERDLAVNHLQGDATAATGSMGRTFTILLVGLNALYCFFFQVIEGTPDAYLAVYVTKGLGKSVQEAAQVVGAFWGAHGLGSVLGIPLAIIIDPVTMTLTNLMICFIGSVLMLFCHSHETIIWISSALIGFGVATLYSASYGWCAKYVTVTGVVGSVFVAAYSLSAAIIQPVVGNIFDTHTPDVMVYIIFLANVLCIVVFLSEIALVYKWSKWTKYNEL